MGSQKPDRAGHAATSEGSPLAAAGCAERSRREPAKEPATITPRPGLHHIRAAAARVHGLHADAIRALGRDHSSIQHALWRFEEMARRAPALRDRCRVVLDLARRIAAGERLPALDVATSLRTRRGRRHQPALPREMPLADRGGPALICRDGAWRLEVRG